MKKLIKLLFGLIIALLLIIAIPTLIIYIMIKDSTDNTNYALYDSSITLESEFTKLFNKGFDLENKDSLDLVLTQDEMNRLIFAFIRESLNEDYLPNATCNADTCNNIKTLYVNVPGIGEQKAVVKSIYAEIKNGELEISVPMRIFGVKTRARLSAKFEETKDSFIIDFETLGMGKANLLSGIGHDIARKIVKKEDIDKLFKDKDLPFTFDFIESKLYIDKEEFNKLVMKFVNPTDMQESDEKSLLTELMATLTDKNNDLVDFGVFGNSFGFKFDLSKFRVDDSITNLINEVKNLDKDHFMSYKTQSLVISNLVSSASTKIPFSNLEFNQLVYHYTNQYQDFKFSFDIPNSTSKMNFEITGILFDFYTDGVVIRINFTLNGLKSSILINGALEAKDDKTIWIKVGDKITIGQDTDESMGEYIIANSSMILNMVGKNMSNAEVISYLAQEKAFVLNADSFTKLMALEDGTTPLVVNKISITDDFFEVYVGLDPSSSIASLLEQATTNFLDILSNNIFDLIDFDTTNQEELEAVTELLETLDSIANGITNSNLSSEDTNQLLENLNNLSPENRNIFLSQLEEATGYDILSQLNGGIFGN